MYPIKCKYETLSRNLFGDEIEELSRLYSGLGGFKGIEDYYLI